MSQINRLIINYQRFVKLPWQQNLASCQKVWLAVYPPAEERRLRARVPEFEIATRDAGHSWHLFDMTHLPARWLGEHDYRDGYFSAPEGLAHIEEELKLYVATELGQVLEEKGSDRNSVLALLGVGSLFGFTHVSSVLNQIEASIGGRLLVFFPGEFERNLYRFMDARDGFNYMAVPITCSERFPT